MWHHPNPSLSFEITQELGVCVGGESYDLSNPPASHIPSAVCVESISALSKVGTTG